MTEMIEKYRPLLYRVSTLYVEGTGFWLPDYSFLVCNEHVVRDQKQVVVKTAGQERQLAHVIFTDSLYDLAFLALTDSHPSMPTLPKAKNAPNTGDLVWALGINGEAPEQGVLETIVDAAGKELYMQHTAILPVNQSGSLLLNAEAQWLGMNTFTLQGNELKGFALPAPVILDIAQTFQKKQSNCAARCKGCRTIITRQQVSPKRHCSVCGTSIDFPCDEPEYEPEGLTKTIEDMLQQLGYNPTLCRTGLHAWELKRGSAHINLHYHEEKGIITGDACLCYLPNQAAFTIESNADTKDVTAFERLYGHSSPTRRHTRLHSLQDLHLTPEQNQDIPTKNEGLIPLDSIAETAATSSKNLKPLYTYLLQENANLKGLTLSLKDQEVYLSMLIFDQYFNADTGRNMLQHLLNEADKYDNILVEKFQALWPEAQDI